MAITKKAINEAVKIIRAAESDAERSRATQEAASIAVRRAQAQAGEIAGLRPDSPKADLDALALAAYPGDTPAMKVAQSQCRSWAKYHEYAETALEAAPRLKAAAQDAGRTLGIDKAALKALTLVKENNGGPPSKAQIAKWLKPKEAEELTPEAFGQKVAKGLTRLGSGAFTAESVKAFQAAIQAAALALVLAEEAEETPAPKPKPKKAKAKAVEPEPEPEPEPVEDEDGDGDDPESFEAFLKYQAWLKDRRKK